MKTFNNKKPYGNKASFSGKAGSGYARGNHDDRPVLHSATCSKCNAPCEVPFKPNGKKPIYCRSCFHKDVGAQIFERSEHQGDNRPSHDRTSFEKPAYRSTPRVCSDEVAKQLKALNAKMDQVLKALLGVGSTQESGNEEANDKT